LRHFYDAIVVGAGGAGLSAALQLISAEELRMAVITKLHPVRSQTGAAQGGISAALGNVDEDSWAWHAFDTVKGGDYLGDQDAIEALCREAPDAIYELEHLGLPFSRTEGGLIDQRRFGGHTSGFGQGAIRRACYARDRTGQMILQTLFQQSVRKGVEFFNEYHVTELLVEGNATRGVVAVELATGRLHAFYARAVLLATGGLGRIFSVTSNGYELTGDGQMLALDAGLPLEDMEFYQFHPTGLGELGILITEGARGEGGVLRNDSGERFMENYAPGLKDLAPRDMVARAIYLETQAGRGVYGGNCVHLDLTHLSPETIHRKLPDIAGFVRSYMEIDPAKDFIPVQPTAHYSMGGIPTDVNGRVRLTAGDDFCQGLYAAGECACVSIHGANRLGSNSLLELLVVGRRAGRDMCRYLRETRPGSEGSSNTVDPCEKTARRLAKLAEPKDADESVASIRDDLQKVMMQEASVFRTGAGLRKCQAELCWLRERYEKVSVSSRKGRFNQELWQAVELGNLLGNAETVVAGALARKESRGAHWREDYPERDDNNWLKHTFVRRGEDGDLVLDYRPVTITSFEPQKRLY